MAAKAAQFWRISPQEAILMPVYWIEVAFQLAEAEKEVETIRTREKEKAAGKGKTSHGRKRRR